MELALLKKVNRESHPNVLRLVGSCTIKGIISAGNVHLSIRCFDFLVNVNFRHYMQKWKGHYLVVKCE